ncbi:uncharacterized protein [Watersipora subatra]|uniref:uncharacterized protein isoform X2 n=1 Tax=Watersipora subatra TaxID=2589382 RepID=UPI00355B44DA
MDGDIMDNKIRYIEQALECLCGLARSGYGQQCRNKYVCNDDDFVIAECCLQLLQNVHSEHPVSEILLNCVSSFHLTHGCTVRTLLNMILVWYRVQRHLERQKLSVKDIEETLNHLLELSISIIDGFCVDVKPVFAKKLQQGYIKPQELSSRLPNVTTSDARSGQNTMSFYESGAVMKLTSPLSEKTSKPDSTLVDTSVAQHRVTGPKTSGLSDTGMNFEDISWYFEGSLSPSVNSGPATPIITSIQQLPLPSCVKESPVKYPSCADNLSDDEFDSCFDTKSLSPPPSIPPPEANNVNDIGWLNNALQAITSKCKSVPTERRSKVYSRNLFSSESISHNDSVLDTPSFSGQSEGEVQSQTNFVGPKMYQSASSCYQSSNEDLFYDASFSGHLFAAKQSRNSLPLSTLSVNTILEGIARGRSIIARLLLEVVDIVTPFVDSILPKHFDSVSCVRCIGPPLSSSQVYEGLILQTSTESLSILTEVSSFRALLFQGDLSASYTPTGYRNSVTCCSEYKGRDIGKECEIPTWCDATTANLCKCNITCVIMKGSCDTLLRDNLLSRQVLVLEKVSYSVIRYISTHCNVPVLHYSSDARENYACEVSITVDDTLAYRKAKTSLIKVKLMPTCTPQPSAISVVLCSPIDNQTFLMEEEFKHALSRLLNILKSGRCIQGLSLSLVAEKLLKHKIKASDGYISVGAEYLAQELRSLAFSRGDPTESHIDDPVSLVAAWRNGLSAADYFSSMSLFVRTGASS